MASSISKKNSPPYLDVVKYIIPYWDFLYQLPDILCGNSCKTQISKLKKQLEICGNRIKAGFCNVIIQDIAVYGTSN